MSNGKTDFKEHIKKQNVALLKKEADANGVTGEGLTHAANTSPKIAEEILTTMSDIVSHTVNAVNAAVNNPTAEGSWDEHFEAIKGIQKLGKIIKRNKENE